jgi:hypothetical protein
MVGRIDEMKQLSTAVVQKKGTAVTAVPPDERRSDYLEYWATNAPVVPTGTVAEIPPKSVV